MAELRYSPEFLRDLEQIEDYISYALFDPDSAVEIINGLLSKTEKLVTFPESGIPLHLPDGTDTGFRGVLYKKYIAVYRVAGDEVQIVRAMHTSQDYLRLLFPWMSHYPHFEN